MLLATLWLTGCSLSAEPIEGRVVDAETGEPLEGVIVVVAWRLQTGFHGQTAGFLVLDEAVTGVDGYFYVPGWKGKRSPAFAVVTRTSPELNFLRGGYKLGYWSNTRHHIMGSPRTRPRSSDWSGEIFELRPYKGDPKEYFNFISGIGEYYTGNPPCTVRRLPILTTEIKRLKARAEHLGVRLTGLPAVHLYEKDECTEKEAIGKTTR